MGIEIVHHQRDPFGLGIVYIEQLLDLMSPIECRALLRNFEMTPTLERVKKQKQRADAITFLLGIVTRGLTGFAGRRLADFFDPLLATLIHAYQGMRWVIGAFVDLEHVFQGTDKLGVSLERDTPLLALPRFQFVFLEPNARSRALSHLPSPSSPTDRPPTVMSSTALPPAARLSAASNPCSTKHSRTRSTVRVLTPSPWLIGSSFHPGPLRPHPLSAKSAHAGACAPPLYPS